MSQDNGYGGRGRPWHPNFVKYMNFIVKHEAYSGMPDAFYEPGRIQWEAPSNRGSGQFKDTHGKRLKWWAQQAGRLGISTSSDKWISRVAKTIHPTKKKPCKICGQELELRYVYPQNRFLAKVRKLPFVEDDFQLSTLERVTSLVSRLVKNYGEDGLAALPLLFTTKQIQPPDPPPHSLRDWIKWLDDIFIPSEPRILSPGAMSNAPDRFDGFHCDNLCCRGTADKGRRKENLQSYVTDRRVFEYWTAGDWVAADRLMGQLRSNFGDEACRHGHPGPCAADHIGPISLGFMHRARFQLLCNSCNSAKNNRMYLSDVELLKADERDGQEVVSWHSQALWDACKERVSSDEQARRLSKLMRDNRHSLMHALQVLAESGAFTFLASLLELRRADSEVEFINLRIEDHLTVYDRVLRTPRKTKYADEQKARRCRIAFKELFSYFEKTNRNSFVVKTKCSDKCLMDAVAALEKVPKVISEVDKNLQSAANADTAEADAAFRAILKELPTDPLPNFILAFGLLKKHMDLIGGELASRWNDERYVRDLDNAEENEDVD